MTGYVTKADATQDGETVDLRIPNKEIFSILEDAVVRYFKDSANADKIKGLMEAFWRKDADAATKLMSDLLWEIISYNDYHEDYYHAFLAGLLVGRGYSVESNKEKGLGRPDILLKDQKNRRALIIEAKKSKREADMDKDCDEALNQIVTEKYAEGLYGYEQVLCYGIAFFLKQAKEKMGREQNSGITPFDSIRGMFVEGEPAYKGAGIVEKTRNQLCIVNPNCIKGNFLPREQELAYAIP